MLVLIFSLNRLRFVRIHILIIITRNKNQFDKAEELYNVLLQQTSNEDEKAVY